MHDVVVVGAGLGGLHCAARLAKAGMRVLVVEKSRHAGGTAAVFRRGEYGFPMGPLSFSSPVTVERYLRELGYTGELSFRRNEFQLRSPAVDLVYSRPLEELEEELGRLFPAERGVGAFFREFRRLVGSLGGEGEGVPDRLRGQSRVPAVKVLAEFFTAPALVNLIGSMGTTIPTMSMLNLALMWKAMSEVGIWYPSCGLPGLQGTLLEALSSAGGELRTGEGAERILVSGGRAAGVRLCTGEEIEARWVVSNADGKKTFLELLDRRAVPASFLARVRSTPYTTSEFCVYLGVDPAKVDLGAMKATHLFYHRREAGKSGAEDFDCREIEICRWTDNEPRLAPPGRVSLVLRVDFPYELFAPLRTGERQRGAGYAAYKQKLARTLVHTAEGALPGLSSAVETMEAATPLTYEDWGHRHRGSIAGWTWAAAGDSGIGEGLLVETPVPHLLLAGIYASPSLFMGGVPTALLTGARAADVILRGRGR